MKDEPTTAGTDAPAPCDLDAIRDRIKDVNDDDMPTPFSVEVAGGLVSVRDAEGLVVADDLELPAASLLAHAPEDLAALCDEVERLRSALSETPEP